MNTLETLIINMWNMNQDPENTDVTPSYGKIIVVSIISS